MINQFMTLRKCALNATRVSHKVILKIGLSAVPSAAGVGPINIAGVIGNENGEEEMVETLVPIPTASGSMPVHSLAYMTAEETWCPDRYCTTLKVHVRVWT
jgi:hypothetical protein